MMKMMMGTTQSPARNVQNVVQPRLNLVKNVLVRNTLSLLVGMTGISSPVLDGVYLDEVDLVGASGSVGTILGRCRLLGGGGIGVDVDAGGDGGGGGGRDDGGAFDIV
jgi:hypothetical protein